MNSTLYVPNPNQWVNYFQTRPADTLKVDTSTIKLASPVQSVVERAKSELDRINSDLSSKRIITASSLQRNQPKQKKTAKTGVKSKINDSKRGLISKTKIKKSKFIQRKQRYSRKNNQSKRVQKKTVKRTSISKDIFD